jgi:hypothetical protein
VNVRVWPLRGRTGVGETEGQPPSPSFSNARSGSAQPTRCDRQRNRNRGGKHARGRAAQARTGEQLEVTAGAHDGLLVEVEQERHAFPIRVHVQLARAGLTVTSKAVQRAPTAVANSHPDYERKNRSLRRESS